MKYIYRLQVSEKSHSIFLSGEKTLVAYLKSLYKEKSKEGTKDLFAGKYDNIKQWLSPLLTGGMVKVYKIFLDSSDKKHEVLNRADVLALLGI